MSTKNKQPRAKLYRHAFVFVSGGCVTGLCDENCKDLSREIHVIDWDNGQNGQCPVCMTDFEADQPTCPTCGLDTDASTDRATIAAYFQWLKVRDES